MAKDHFISVTFLNNFTDNQQVAEAREKTVFCFSNNTKSFNDQLSKLGKIAYQKDLDGDGDFRCKLNNYEQKWTGLYSKITQNNFLEQDYEEVLMYLFLLKLNNPKQQKDRIDLLLTQATPLEVKHLDSLKFKVKHKQTRDILIGSKYIETLTIEYLTRPYRIVKNVSSVPFVTSDNPWLSFKDYQFIPISKEFALQICTKLYVEMGGRNQGLHVLSDSTDVRIVNSLMIRNAERFVYASSKDVFD